MLKDALPYTIQVPAAVKLVYHVPLAKAGGQVRAGVLHSETTKRSVLRYFVHPFFIKARIRNFYDFH
jgi:hypothetical protein